MTWRPPDVRHTPLISVPSAPGNHNPITSNQGLTLVPISAQLELTLPLSAQRKLTSSPI
jgi:hypothetical protein